MSASQMRPAYRTTVYAPRGVDPTETTVLVPIAGAAHSDPFQVATVQGLAGFKPYLGWPKGTRGKLDPITKKRTSGTMPLALQDQRVGATGSNAVRWATTFLGDSAKRSQLKGCLVRIEEALDWDPVALTGTFVPYFTGRIQKVSLTSALLITLSLTDLANDFNQPIFLGAPHPSVSYAFRASAFPIGLPYPWANVTPFDWLTGTIMGGGEAFNIPRFGSIQIDTAIDPWRTVITQTLDGLRHDTKSMLVVMKNLSTGRVGLYTNRDDGQYRGLASFSGKAPHWRFTNLYQIGRLDGPGALDVPAAGTAVSFFIVPTGAPTEALPLFVQDVHPIQFMMDIADGKFSLSTDSAALRPLAARDTSDGGPWAKLLADPSFIPIRPVVTEPTKANDVFEKWCGPLGIGYDFDGAGKVYPIDLRRSANTVPVALITDTDLAAATDPAWDDDQSMALMAVELDYYIDSPVPLGDLTASTDTYPNIPPTMLTASQKGVLVVGDTTALRDVGAKVQKIDCKALRVMDGEINPANPLQSAADVLEARLDALGQEILYPFAAGGITGTLPLRRPSPALAVVQNGSYFAHQCTKLPDPATNQRGGARLALCLSRNDQSEKSTISFLDLGAAVVAPQPAVTSAAVASDDPGGIDVVGVATTTGDSVEYWTCVTAPGTTVRPDERDTRWQSSGSGGTGTTRLHGFPSGTRVWIRAIERPPLERPSLPSAWAYLGGTGYVDMAGLTVVSAVTVPAPTLFANRADVTWTLGDVSQQVEVYLTIGGVPGTWTMAMLFTVMPAGTAKIRLTNLVASTGYAVGVLVRDPRGGPSTMATQTLTTTSTPGTAPAPTAVDVGFTGSTW
jgi:hypothetical protein